MAAFGHILWTPFVPTTFPKFFNSRPFSLTQMTSLQVIGCFFLGVVGVVVTDELGHGCDWEWDYLFKVICSSCHPLAVEVQPVHF
jgi:hypothetical protein